MEAYGESGRVMRQVPIGNVEIYLTCFLPNQLVAPKKVFTHVYKTLRSVVDSPVWNIRRAISKHPMEKV